MPIYVDNMNAKFGRMIMCHLIADSDQELHDMADKIGVQRKWHQKPPKSKHSHYDIALVKKKLAIENGAIEITWRQASCMSKRKLIEGVLGKPEEAEEWFKNYMKEYQKI